MNTQFIRLICKKKGETSQRKRRYYPVRKDRLADILTHISVPVGHPDFLGQLFTALTRDLKMRAKERQRQTGPFRRLMIKEYDGISRRLDATQIQEGCSVRNNLRTRRLALQLVGEDGKLAKDRLARAIPAIEKHLYSLGPGRHHDYRRNEHILRVLTALRESPQLQTVFHSISKPYGNPPADALIRDTLQLDPQSAVKDREARQATLAAWLCYLRQNVGSCFATAPAIIVHDQQPEQFLIDIRDLLATGRLTRTFGGVQYSVPLSASWGAGDLKRPFVCHPDPDQAKTPIWESPGLIVALTRVGILDAKVPLPRRVQQCKRFLVQLYGDDPAIDGPFTCSAEEMIQKLVMRHMEVTEKDLEEYETRPRAMIHSGLMMQSSGGGGKGKRIREFYDTVEEAHRAFKSLTDNALLKAWEFSVASFAEVKPSLSRYNMYHSLGLGSDDEGGIGQALYTELKAKVDTFNAESQEYQEIYEQMYVQVKHVEGRLRRASEQEAQYLKGEYRNRVREMDHYQRLRDDASTKAQRFANLFETLISLYDTKFVEHFQEVYDPDIHEVDVGPYDDSPAGFRLLYKAGRTHTSQWERIDSPNQFVDALAGFFVATEQDIAHSGHYDGIEDDVAALITTLVSHVKTQGFLTSAFDRMARAHNAHPIKDPLNNLDKVPKKPWVYTSGGTMGSLVSAYFCLDGKPAESDRWVENESELLAFLVDTVKQMPDKDSDLFIDDPNRSLLIHSPTHAFLLKPGGAVFGSGWQSEDYTYTWIRDQAVTPTERMIDRIQLDDAMIAKLLEMLRESLPKEYHHYFNKAFYRVPRSMGCTDFRRFVVDTIERTRNLRYGARPVISADEVDAMLYRQLPMTRGYELTDRVEAILKGTGLLTDDEVTKVMDIYDSVSRQCSREEVIGAEGLREIVQAVLMIHMQACSSGKPLLQAVVATMRKERWALPMPVTFADTNWVKDDFAFAVSPGTGKVELWRVDAYGLEGYPMSYWKHWVDGSRQDRTWGVYTKPYQYQAR